MGHVQFNHNVSKYDLIMFTISRFNRVHRAVVIAGDASPHATVGIIGARMGDNITTR